MTALAAQMPGCHTEVYHCFFSLRMQTNKPRNYNCLPAESVIGGNNDISGLLIFLPLRLALVYWGTCHPPLWWDEFNLSTVMTMQPFSCWEMIRGRVYLLCHHERNWALCSIRGTCARLLQGNRGWGWNQNMSPFASLCFLGCDCWML